MKQKFWITALAFAFGSAICMIIYFFISEGGLTLGIIASASMSGLIGGPLFAWMMLYSAKRLGNTITVEITDQGTTRKEGGANLLRGKESVGGKLVPTNQRLIFKSHRFNIRNLQESFHLGEIEKLQVTNSLMFVENRLTVELSNGTSNNLVVDEAAEWCKEILRQKQFLE